MKVPMTYEQYDEMWEICDHIKEESEQTEGSYKRKFFAKTSYPTVEEMKKMNLKENLGKYLPYIMFYYLEPLEGMEDDPQYVASMKYIKNLVDNCLDLRE